MGGRRSRWALATPARGAEEETPAGRSGTLRPAGAWKIRQRRSPAFNLLRRVLCGEAEGRGDGEIGNEGAKEAAALGGVDAVCNRNGPIGNEGENEGQDVYEGNGLSRAMRRRTVPSCHTMVFSFYQSSSVATSPHLARARPRLVPASPRLVVGYRPLPSKPHHWFGLRG